MKSKIQNLKSQIPIVALLFIAGVSGAAFMTGCPKNAPPHPGAVSSFDSQSYDALLVAQEVINQAKDSLAAGKLPASAKPVLNRAIESYNVARGAWLTYRAAVQVGQDPQAAAAKLQQAIVELTAAVAAIPKLEGRTP